MRRPPYRPHLRVPSVRRPPASVRRLLSQRRPLAYNTPASVRRSYERAALYLPLLLPLVLIGYQGD